MIKSSESLCWEVDKLSIVNEILVSSSRWKVGHVDVISFSIVDRRILISKETHKKITKFTIKQVAYQRGGSGIQKVVREEVVHVDGLEKSNNDLPVDFPGYELKEYLAVVRH